MEREQPRNGGNGHSRARLSPKQELAFKSMALLTKPERREVLDMVIMYELIEDRSEGKAILARLQSRL